MALLAYLQVVFSPRLMQFSQGSSRLHFALSSSALTFILMRRRVEGYFRIRHCSQDVGRRFRLLSLYTIGVSLEFMLMT